MTSSQALRTPRVLAAVLTMALGLVLGAFGDRAHAASSEGCVGGGFSLMLPGGAVSGERDRTVVPSATVGDSFLVRGRFVEFTVEAATLGVTNYTMTGAANELDMTGGRRTPVFAAKTPDLRGARLTSDLAVELKGEDLVISRTGTGVSMKVQAKDCAQGGIFQMEPERSDGSATTFTHTLADGVFYFDNPFFRARLGQVLNGVEVTARVNFANDVSPSFVGRDSAQVAERVSQNGRRSVWSVASGGRVGGVLGEDAVEVAPPATDCVKDCQAQNQVRGRFVVLGFPFPVPLASRLAPLQGPAPGASAVLGSPAAPARRAVRNLRATGRLRLGTLHRRGLRLDLGLPPGTRVVRIALFRVRGAAVARRPLAVRYRTTPRGARQLRVRLGRSVVRQLRPGRYVARVRAGRTRAQLGRAVTLRFTVVR
jgi:hypothetical protein